MVALLDNIAARAATPAMWLIVLGMAYTLASTLLFLAAPPETGPGEALRPDALATGGAQPRVDLTSILNANLFGTVGAEASQAAASEPLAETRLPLVLLGVFVADTPEQSTVILARKGSPEKLYHIGDEVPGNAILEAVYLDHVRLRRGRVQERLAFPKPEQRLASPNRPSERARYSQAPPTNASSRPPRLPPRPGWQNRAYQSPETMAEHYRERLKRDPANTLNELGLTPVNSGEASGYRLDHLARSPYLRQTGLQPGDVVLSINGRPLGNPGRDLLELDSVLAQGSARIEVQRGNRRFFITASLK